VSRERLNQRRVPARECSYEGDIVDIQNGSRSIGMLSAWRLRAIAPARPAST
jgi:hypothetical protein